MRIILAVLLLSLFSCGSKGNHFVLETDNAHGLKKGDSLYIKTIGVGKIVDVALNNSNYHVCLSVEMNEDIEIPEDSRFSICNSDFFSRGIEIIPGKSNAILSSDTVFKEIEVRNIPLDSIVEDIANNLHRSLPSKR